MDFTAHNREARAVWEAFHSGKPVRMPMTLGINPRFYLLDSSLNAECISFQQYSENAEIMAEVQIRNAHYIRHHIYADHEMGLPEDGWRVYVDLLKFGVQLYSRESDLYRFVIDFRYLVATSGVECRKADEAVGVLRYALCDK